MLLTLVSNIQSYSNTDTTEFTFKSNNRIDICDNSLSKDILVTLELGEIKQDDNLESIAFEIVYDISIFRFDFVLTSNTLLDQFEYKNYSISNSEGVIVIDAGNTTIGKSVFGNKVFLALSGKVKSEICDKDGFIRVNRVLFNDEYKRKNLKLNTYLMPNEINIEKAGKWISRANFDTIFFDTNEVKKQVSFNISLDNSFEYFNFTMPKVIGSYEINNIVLSNTKFLLAINDIENNFEIKISDTNKVNTNKIKSFDLIFEINKNNIDTNDYEFKIQDLIFNDCNCNLNSESKPIFISQIKYNKDTIDTNDTTSISVYNRKAENIYTFNNNILKIDNIDLDIKYIKIWNLQGNLLHNFDIKQTSNLIINLQNEFDNILLTQFIYKDNSYNTIKLLKE